MVRILLFFTCVLAVLVSGNIAFAVLDGPLVGVTITPGTSVERDPYAPRPGKQPWIMVKPSQKSEYYEMKAAAARTKAAEEKAKQEEEAKKATAESLPKEEPQDPAIGAVGGLGPVGPNNTSEPVAAPQ